MCFLCSAVHVTVDFFLSYASLSVEYIIASDSAGGVRGQSSFHLHFFLLGNNIFCFLCIVYYNVCEKYFLERK